MHTAPDHVVNAIEDCFETLNLTIEKEIQAEEDYGDNIYSVKTIGELLWQDDLQDGHGNLMYSKEEGLTIAFYGIIDGRILLKIDEHA